jgi:hypothetical protein
MRFILPLLAVAALGACESGTGTDRARVSVRLVDAPGNFREAHVQITGIYLQRESDSDSTSGRLTLAGPANTYYNLLALTNGNFAALVRDAVIPAGTYNIVRVKVGDAYVVTKDGKVYATDGAQLPAGVAATGRINTTRGKSSGYQIRFPGRGLVVESDAKILALDFDVARSFGVVAGNSNQLVLNPSFTVTNVEISGGIAGTVSATGVTFPACGGAGTDLTHFVATATGPSTLSAKAGADGKYAMAYVASGTYAMGVAPIGYTNGDTLTFTAAPTPASATVASGQTATVNYVVSATACKAVAAK